MRSSICSRARCNSIVNCSVDGFDATAMAAASRASVAFCSTRRVNDRTLSIDALCAACNSENDTNDAAFVDSNSRNVLSRTAMMTLKSRISDCDADDADDADARSDVSDAIVRSFASSTPSTASLRRSVARADDDNADDVDDDDRGDGDGDGDDKGIIALGDGDDDGSSE